MTTRARNRTQVLILSILVTGLLYAGTSYFDVISATGLISTTAVPGFSGNGASLTAVNASTLEGQNGAHYKARANHTGTQTKATISNFTHDHTSSGDGGGASLSPVVLYAPSTTPAATRQIAVDGTGLKAHDGTAVRTYLYDLVEGSGIDITGTGPTRTIAATGGGGSITGSGTPDSIAKFTVTTAIGDSRITDPGAGSNVTINAGSDDIELLGGLVLVSQIQKAVSVGMVVVPFLDLTATGMLRIPNKTGDPNIGASPFFDNLMIDSDSNELEWHAGSVKRAVDKESAQTISGLKKFADVITREGPNGVILSYLNTGVAHGMTALVPTNEAGRLASPSSAGGIFMGGYTGGQAAVFFQSNSTTIDTANNLLGTMVFDARKKNGTGITSLGATENMIVFRNNAATKFSFDGDGNAYADAVWTDSAFDLAEDYDVRVTADQDNDPGTVLTVDLIHDNRLTPSTESYQVVAGVVSYHQAQLADGMNNIREKFPLMALHTYENTQPVALVGLVPTKVCDENGPIGRGDLLVSSSKRGYAMRAGKLAAWLHGGSRIEVGIALGELKSGTGVINAQR